MTANRFLLILLEYHKATVLNQYVYVVLLGGRESAASSFTISDMEWEILGKGLIFIMFSK